MRLSRRGVGGGDAAAEIRDTARTKASAIIPSTQAPEGLGLLVTTMDERLGAMQHEIGATREQLQAAAQRIRQHREDLAAAMPEPTR